MTARGNPGAGTAHFAILDGLRGLAALCVVIFHLTIKPTRLVPVPDYGGWLGHAYLAVDFFFLLSGFVIAHAYERRILGGFTFGEFFRARLIRLYPMFLVGLLIGAVGAWVQKGPAPFSVLSFIQQALFIPRYQHGQFAFPYNLPAWSLFFEVVINLAYAAFLRHLKTPLMIAIMAVSAVLLAGPGLVHDGINFGGGHPGLPLGLPRVALSFFYGVLLFRAYHAQRLTRYAISPAVASLVLIGLLVFPAGGGWRGDLYDMVCVLAGFPALIVVCLHIASANRLFRIAGDLSYPVYAIHFPLLTLLTTWLGYATMAGSARLWLDVVLLTAAVVATGWVLLKFYDEPLRRSFRPRIRTFAATVP